MVYVYFVAEPPASGALAPCGPVKIGISSDINGRMPGIQNGNPRPLSLLGVLPFIDRLAARDGERDLHERFADHRLSGEWFDPDPTLLSYIGTYARPAMIRKPGPVAITLRQYGADRTNCPQCNGEPIVSGLGGAYRVRCISCYRGGPIRETYDGALEAWNASEDCAPGALVYRSQRPRRALLTPEARAANSD